MIRTVRWRISGPLQLACFRSNSYCYKQRALQIPFIQVLYSALHLQLICVLLIGKYFRLNEMESHFQFCVCNI